MIGSNLEWKEKIKVTILKGINIVNEWQIWSYNNSVTLYLHLNVLNRTKKIKTLWNWYLNERKCEAECCLCVIRNEVWSLAIFPGGLLNEKVIRELGMTPAVKKNQRRVLYFMNLYNSLKRLKMPCCT